MVCVHSLLRDGKGRPAGRTRKAPEDVQVGLFVCVSKDALGLEQDQVPRKKGPSAVAMYSVP